MLRWSGVHDGAADDPRGGARRDVTVRLRWLTHEGRIDEALTLTRLAGTVAAQGAWLDLAEAMAPTHRDEAARIFERALRAQMRHAQSPYREPLALARRWLVLLPAARARQCLAQLKAEYRAKRNFVTGLDALGRG